MCGIVKASFRAYDVFITVPQKGCDYFNERSCLRINLLPFVCYCLGNLLEGSDWCRNEERQYGNSELFAQQLHQGECTQIFQLTTVCLDVFSFLPRDVPITRENVLQMLESRRQWWKIKILVPSLKTSCWCVRIRSSLLFGFKELGPFEDEEKVVDVVWLE